MKAKIYACDMCGYRCIMVVMGTFSPPLYCPLDETSPVWRKVDDE